MRQPTPQLAANPPHRPAPVGTFAAVVRHELLSSRRNRLAHALLAVLLAMVAVSALIGWLTTTTVTSVWAQTTAAGLTTAPNPFAAAPPLVYAKNVVIYVVLIGALLAIVLGSTAALRARRSRTVDLLLTRPVRVRTYLLGQVAGLGALLGVVLAAACVTAWIGIALVLRQPLDAPSTARLAGFFAVAWLLLVGFAVLGMISGLHARTQTLAVLAPIVGWSVIVFVLPQLGTAALPVSLLNPVPSVVTTGGGFGLVHAVLGPLSVTEQFKVLAGALLGTGPTAAAPAAGAAVLAFLALGLVVLLSTQRALLRRGLHD